MLQLGQSAGLPDAHHRPPGVGLAEKRFHRFWRLCSAERHVNGGKNTARQRQQMRAEDHLRFRQAGVLDDFRCMAMRKKIVGLEIFVQLGKLQVSPWLFARAGRSGLAIANNRRAGSDPSSIRKRPNRKDHAGRVAAGIRDQPSLRNLLRVKFRQSISRLAKQCRMRCRQLVPALKYFGLAKPKRAAQIHHPQPRCQQLRCNLRGSFMRRGQKRRARAAGGNRLNRQRAHRRLPPSAKLRK